MSVDDVHAAKHPIAAPEPEEPPPHDKPPQEQLQPEAARVEKPIIIWRGLMLEQ
ncbi:hypothetical protein HU811_06065 [Pseudomonas sp. SWRI196]|uniref:Uncharacterized protein n=1 Tax=Pseudomonas tehranensis TaxID=2745502 RepID=A0ABR6UNM0_9PSED|nr:hypothetical protein [Pseudomonas tehranensis]MBC3346196.1 hypothetical protein [Pseudomonas tehranensis]